MVRHSAAVRMSPRLNFAEHTDNALVKSPWNEDGSRAVTSRELSSPPLEHHHVSFAKSTHIDSLTQPTPHHRSHPRYSCRSRTSPSPFLCCAIHLEAYSHLFPEGRLQHQRRHHDGALRRHLPAGQWNEASKWDQARPANRQGCIDVLSLHTPIHMARCGNASPLLYISLPTRTLFLSLFCLYVSMFLCMCANASECRFVLLSLCLCISVLVSLTVLFLSCSSSLPFFFFFRSVTLSPCRCVQFGPLKVSEMGIGTWAWGNRLLVRTILQGTLLIEHLCSEISWILISTEIS